MRSSHTVVECNQAAIRYDTIRRMRFGRLTHVAQVHGVDVYIHWSIFAIVIVILAGLTRKPVSTLLGMMAYLGLLVIHESGHLIMARRRGYRAFSMALYPIFGLASFEAPDTRIDRALIAWGGVLAQFVVAIPLTVYIVLIGYTPFEPLNAVLAILGGYSLLVAAFNLLPIRPLDGSKAWDIVPAWLEQRRMRGGSVVTEPRP
jgi:Zn-dependent protease